MFRACKILKEIKTLSEHEKGKAILPPDLRQAYATEVLALVAYAAELRAREHQHCCFEGHKLGTE